jgi:hypothetical protein
MIIEQRTFEFTTKGYHDAVDFLTRIGKFGPFHSHLPIDQIIAEANEIKQSQQILTEGN